MLTTTDRLLEHLRIDKRDLVRDGMLVWNDGGDSGATPTPSGVVSAATIEVTDVKVKLEWTDGSSDESASLLLGDYASLSELASGIAAQGNGWRTQILAHPSSSPANLVPMPEPIDVLGFGSSYPVEIYDLHWVETLLTTVSDWMERFFHRTIAETEYVDEEYSGDGSSLLALRSYPVTSVSSVTIDDVAVTYEVDYERGMLWNSAGWTKGTNNIKVTYTAGYSTVPEALQELCCKVAAAMYFQAGENPRVVSDKLGSYTRRMMESVLPPDVVNELYLWKRMEPVLPSD